VLEGRLAAIEALAEEMLETVLAGNNLVYGMTLSAATETVCTLAQQLVAGHCIFDDEDGAKSEGWSLRLLRAFGAVGEEPQVSRK
jgi:hypothetical protein